MNTRRSRAPPNTEAGRLCEAPLPTAAQDAPEVVEASIRRMRPARVSAGMFATALSLLSVAGPGRLSGTCCAGVAPNSAGRSHVLNGAVNGKSTSTNMQQAVTRDRIGFTVAGPDSKVRATREHREDPVARGAFVRGSPSKCLTSHPPQQHTLMSCQRQASDITVPSRPPAALPTAAAGVRERQKYRSFCWTTAFLSLSSRSLTPLSSRFQRAGCFPPDLRWRFSCSGIMKYPVMLRKLIAAVLLVLSALPFTAPFATVDMPTLLGERSFGSPDQTVLTPSVEDGSHALVGQAAGVRVRFRSLLRLESHFATPHAVAPVREIDCSVSVAFRLTDHPSLTALRI